MSSVKASDDFDGEVVVVSVSESDCTGHGVGEFSEHAAVNNVGSGTICGFAVECFIDIALAGTVSLIGGEVVALAGFEGEFTHDDGILADDEADFVNRSYRKVYEEYFSMYDEGLTQQQMQQRLLNSMDPEVSAVARDLLIEKHQLTVKNYEQSLTSISTRLVMYVPKTLLTYQVKKVELYLKELTAELGQTSDMDRQIELMTRIGEYNTARTRLNNELGRV